MKKQKEPTIKQRDHVKNSPSKFRRQESWRYGRVKDSWRKARGIDSKMRKKVKGWPSSPNIGFRSPKGTRNLHPSGYVELRVQNVKDINNVESETQAIRVSRTIGKKKRVEILVDAKAKGIHVLNISLKA